MIQGLGLGLNKNKKTSFLLDGFLGVVAAIGFRHLSSQYSGDVVTIRNSNADEEGFLPSGFSNGSVLSFLNEGDGSGLIKTFFDLTGNGNHFTQTDPTRMPRIATGGVIDTLNGKPCVVADGINDFMQTSAGIVGLVSDFTSFTVGSFTQTGQANDAFWGASAGNYAAGNWIGFRQLSGSNNFRVNGSTTEEAANLTSDTDQHIFYCNYKGGESVTLGVDGVNSVESTDVPASLNLSQEFDLFGLDNNGTPVALGACRFQELILFDSNQSGNQSVIETEINSYYSIY